MSVCLQNVFAKEFTQMRLAGNQPSCLEYVYLRVYVKLGRLLIGHAYWLIAWKPALTWNQT